MEPEDRSEKLNTKNPQSNNNPLTLQKAIEMGEYDPGYLSTFPEWQTLTKHIQFQYIKQAINNRHNQLLTQWAEVVNIIDFAKKPYLQETLKNIQTQWKKLDEEKERLYIQYSTP